MTAFIGGEEILQECTLDVSFCLLWLWQSTGRWAGQQKGKPGVSFFCPLLVSAHGIREDG
jgi:hypothetical protein